MSAINAHDRFHFHHTKAFLTHQAPIEQLPKPDFPEKRFSKLAGDTVTFSESAVSLVAQIGKYSTDGLWQNGMFSKS